MGVKAFALSFVVFVSLVVMIFAGVIFFVYPVKYKSEVKAAAAEFGVSASLVESVIKAESKFNPSAVSPKGAVGLMQILPSTAAWVAGDVGRPGTFEDGWDLKNPRDNIRIGTCYLAYLIKRFGDERTAVIAYNAGEGNVETWAAAAPGHKVVTTPYKETNQYVERVFNAKNYYRFRI